MIRKNPGDYILIGDSDKKHLSPITGYKHLRRLHRGCLVPEGFIKVNFLNNQSVYDTEELLLPKHQALQRLPFLERSFYEKLK